MSRRRPVSVREALVAINEHGYSPAVEIGGTGHFKVTWRANGRQVMLVIARTPGDYRGNLTARATLKRLLRMEERP